MKLLFKTWYFKINDIFWQVIPTADFFKFSMTFYPRSQTWSSEFACLTPGAKRHGATVETSQLSWSPAIWRKLLRLFKNKNKNKSDIMLHSNLPILKPKPRLIICDHKQKKKNISWTLVAYFNDAVSVHSQHNHKE